MIRRVMLFLATIVAAFAVAGVASADGCACGGGSYLSGQGPTGSNPTWFCQWTYYYPNGSGGYVIAISYTYNNNNYC